MSLCTTATRSLVTVSPSASLDKALVLMDEFHIRHLPVVRDGLLVGMLSDRDLLLAVGWRASLERRVGTPDGATTVGPHDVSQIMSRHVITLRSDQTLHDAARLMVNHKIGALPIVQDGRLVGLVTETDLLEALQAAPPENSGARRLLATHVREVMRASVTTVGPRATLQEVIQVFTRLRVRHVPVVVNDRLVGIISDRDVRRALGESAIRDAQSEESGRFYLGPQTAMDIMTRAVQAVAPTATVSEAIDAMRALGVHGLPVVHEGRLTGILTYTDILRAVSALRLL